jgi:hypothetical protein
LEKPISTVLGGARCNAEHSIAIIPTHPWDLSGRWTSVATYSPKWQESPRNLETGVITRFNSALKHLTEQNEKQAQMPAELLQQLS